MIAGIIPDWFYSWASELMHAVAQKAIDWLVGVITDGRLAGETWLELIHTSLVGVFPSLTPVYAGSTLAHINYFFPLGELLVFTVTLLTTRGLILVYRIIKSWVPFLSS